MPTTKPDHKTAGKTNRKMKRQRRATWYPDPSRIYEEIQADPEQKKAFEVLSKKCDREFFLLALAQLRRPDPEQTHPRGSPLGFEKENMATVINRMRACADDCDRFLWSGLGIGLRSTRANKPEGKHLEEMGRAVPEFLRFLADAAEALAKIYRSGDATRATRAEITVHVKLRTGRWHDREIGALLGVDDKSQQKWRNENHRAVNGFMEYESAKQR